MCSSIADKALPDQRIATGYRFYRFTRWPVPVTAAAPIAALVLPMLVSLVTPVAAQASPAKPLILTTNPRDSANTQQFSQWLENRPDMDKAASDPGLSATALREILAQAALQAQQRSPQVQKAQAEWGATQADTQEAKGQRWPQIDVGVSSPNKAIKGHNSRAFNNDPSASVNVNTMVYDWGRISSNVGSREQIATAAGQRLQITLSGITFEVVNNIADLSKNRLIQEVSEHYLERMQTLVSMLDQVVQTDRGRLSEMTQAKARMLQAQASRDMVAARVKDLELNLSKLLGEVPGNLPAARSWPLEPVNLQSMLSRLDARPLYLQMQAETQAAKMQAEAARATGRPQLNWVVTRSSAKDALGERQPWQTRLELNWPLSRGGSYSAAERAAVQRAEASRQNQEQMLLDAEYRVRMADQEARILLARAEDFRSLSSETASVRKAFFEQWYHLGRRTLLDVLIAESDHYNNSVSEVTSRFEGYQAIFRQLNEAGELLDWLEDSAPPT